MQEPSQSEFDKISPTALMVASARAFADIPYSKGLSRLVNAQSVVENLLGQKLEQVAEIAILIESRYRAIDQLVADRLTKNTLTQIIELASGLLPRGMVMSQDPDVNFIESDLPLMISQKASLVKELVGDRPNLHFIPIDIACKSNQLIACTKYLAGSEPIIILCEGLLMYFSHPQKHQVFNHIRELLQNYGGVWITSDFVTVEAINRRKQISPNLQKISQMVSRLSDRPISDTYFQNSQEIEDFIASQGFKCDRTPVLDLIHLDQVTCLKPLNLDPQTAEAILADSFVYSLRLS